MKRKLFVVQWLIGIGLALIGAGIMFHGNIFGENNSGITTVIGIFGLCLIAKYSPWKVKKKEIQKILEVRG
ncbi:MAG: hypothetical protein ACE5HW_00390 [Candidatus Methanofastidiosia archaeon]